MRRALAANRFALMADVCGLMDHVRPRSQPAPAPNDRNKTVDRPIPSENTVADEGSGQLARAPLPRALINWRLLRPRVPLHRMPLRHDEYRRKYQRDLKAPD